MVSLDDFATCADIGRVENTKTHTLKLAHVCREITTEKSGPKGKTVSKGQCLLRYIASNPCIKNCDTIWNIWKKLPEESKTYLRKEREKEKAIQENLRNNP